MKCEQACPANVDYGKIIDAGRAMSQTELSGLQKIQQSFVLLVLSNAPLRKLFKTLNSVLKSSGLMHLLSGFRIFKLTPSTNTARFSTENTNTSNGPNVLIVSSCANDFFNDPTYSAAVSLLNKLGCNVHEPNHSPCCGALHQHTGNLHKAENLKQEFINSFKNNNVDYLSSIATGCGAHIKQYENELNKKVIDINELLLLQLEKQAISFNSLKEKVFVHQPCTQNQISSEKNLVERLLNHIPDIELQQFKDQTGCCGAGGMNSITNAELANQLIDNKVDELSKFRNSILVTSNIGCALHFQARLKQENIPLRVCHPATLLAEQMV